MKARSEVLWAPLFRSKIIIVILAGSLGLCLGYPNNFLSCPLLILLWPVSVGLLGLFAKTPYWALFYGWLSSFLGASCALYWLYLPVKNVGGLPFPLALLCALFIAACLALQGGIFALLSRLLSALAPWRLALCLCLLWYLLEYSFAFIFGFPWIQLSGALIIWPVLLQHANLIGAWLGASLWLFPCFLLVFSPSGIKWYCRCIFAFIIFALFTGYGLFRTIDHVSSYLADENSVTAIFVEGNVDQNQKWIPSFQRWNIDLYTKMTDKAVSEAKAKGIKEPLVIWPETALPIFFERSPALAEMVINCAKTNNCPLIFGAPGIEKDSQSEEDLIFNRAFMIDPEGSIIGHYDKEHLVPFGEYLPKWLNWKFLEALLQGVGIYQQGNNSAPLRYQSLALGMLICYEGIFPWLAEERVSAGANILVDISNDGWFGNSPAARQHLYLTAPRCLEQNRWLLRATNTGISAVIDNYGRIVSKGEQFVTESLLVHANLESDISIYNKIAKWLPLIILALACILAAPAALIKQQDIANGTIKCFKNK